MLHIICSCIFLKVKKFSISIEDKPERGSVTLSGHNQVNVSGATAGGNITIHMGGGQGMLYHYYARHAS